MKGLTIRCDIKYGSEKQQPEVDKIVTQLRKEGWKIDGQPLHKEGLNLHIISMKRGKKTIKNYI